ncbi:MAG TPA: enoyl-CoA hydratase-related protein [Hyphomonas sp.]|nr:enoyl-CoA hydratase-related protein [Hyphomonas sp.]HRX73365.1 enoyl-CoA hydratase-related protein [Hyphomonas sp.]
MSDGLKIDRDGHVTILTLDRPEAMNALDYPTYMALEDAIRGADARAIIITGAGDRAFCSGDDVKQILSKGAPTTPEMAERAKRTGGLTPAADALLHTDIPLIAAVNGFALGWGAELAIMADLRVFSEKARFGELFVKRGLTCDAPGFGRLIQLVGRERACDLLLTGDIIDAATAKEIGLTARVVLHEDLMPTTLALAHKIAANPPLAVQAIKKGLRETVDPDWREVGRMAITEIRRLMQTADARESAAAFLEKREPVFTGR